MTQRTFIQKAAERVLSGDVLAAEDARERSHHIQHRHDVSGHRLRAHVIHLRQVE